MHSAVAFGHIRGDRYRSPLYLTDKAVLLLSRHHFNQSVDLYNKVHPPLPNFQLPIRAFAFHCVPLLTSPKTLDPRHYSPLLLSRIIFGIAPFTNGGP